jgi:hypothetical protein
VFEPGDGDQQQEHENNQALFGWRENEDAEEPFHPAT